MTPKEPRSESLLAARIMRAYPTLSCYSAATLAEELCRIERMQRKHAERCCSGEDGGYVKIRAAVAGESARGYSNGVGYLREHDPVAEHNAEARILRNLDAWKARILDLHEPHRPRGEDGQRYPPLDLPEIELEGDPRGAVLLLKLPNDPEPIAV